VADYIILLFATYWDSGRGHGTGRILRKRHRINKCSQTLVA